MIAICDAFSIQYGERRLHDKGPLLKLPGTTPLIASGGRNNGIYGRFNIPATKQNILTVASTGSAGATFFHGYPCEVSDDALVLSPKSHLSPSEMLWFVHTIRANRHRFHYGRKVTPERLGILRVPRPPKGDRLPQLSEVAESVASEFEALKLGDLSAGVKSNKFNTVGDLFDITYGNSYELCNLKSTTRGVNFVSRTTQNNGVSANVERTADAPFPAGNMTVALGSQGGVLSTFVQMEPFYTGRDVAVLTSKAAMTLEQKLFCCLGIMLHKFRYSFGRQANRTLPQLLIPPFPKWASSNMAARVQRGIAADVRAMFPAE